MRCEVRGERVRGLRARRFSTPLTSFLPPLTYVANILERRRGAPSLEEESSL
jgi:hypothetical protein